MNLGPSLYPLPELDRQLIDPTGLCLAIVLVKIQRIESAGRSQENKYSFKSDFDTMSKEVVNQDFGRQNNSMS